MKLSSILILMLVILGSCQQPNARYVIDEEKHQQKIITPSKTEYDLYEWEHKGHTYILIDRPNGSGIAHAGHCRCYQQ